MLFKKLVAFAAITAMVMPSLAAPFSVFAAAPIAQNDLYLTDQNVPVSGNVLDNDTDADGDVLTVSLDSGVGSGSLTLNSDGSFLYTPDTDYVGSDGFMYTVTDGTETALGSVIILMSSADNTAPVAVNDTYNTDVDQFIDFNVITNDTDADGDSLRIFLEFTSEPANGTLLTQSFTGNIRYRPDSGYTGVDTFTYLLSDGESVDTGTVTINVGVTGGNTAPVAVNDSFTTDMNVNLSGNVITNDTDADGDTLYISSYTLPTNGTLDLVGEGNFSYVPDTDFVGVDTFTYYITDGVDYSNTATVTILVLPIDVNTAPVANNDSAITTFETPVSFNVLGNDTDADGDTLQTIFFSFPSNGTLVSDINGNITYTPDAGFSGVDTFTYTASDGTATDTATVSITVRPEVASSPVAVDDVFPTLFHVYDPSDFWTYNSPFSLLENDSHPDGLEIFAFEETVEIYSDNMSTLYGVLSIFEDGFVSFTPEPSLPVGSYDIEYVYMIYDENDNGDIATLSFTLEVVPNVAPVAVNDNFAIYQDSNLSGNLLLNDTDADGDSFVVNDFTAVTNGTLSVNNDGTFTYTPNNGFVGNDSFTYRVIDEFGAVSGYATVTINVVALPANNAPVANADSYSTDRNIAVSGNVLTNDTDAEADVLSVVSNTNPTNGTVSVNSNGTFTYTPNNGFVGSDSFTYTVSDGTDTATTTVTVTVSGEVLGTNPGNGGAVLPGTGSNAVAIATLALVMFTAVTAAAAYTAKREQF